MILVKYISHFSLVWDSLLHMWLCRLEKPCWYFARKNDCAFTATGQIQAQVNSYYKLVINNSICYSVVIISGNIIMLVVGGYTSGILGGNLAVRMSGGTNYLGPFLKEHQDLF